MVLKKISSISMQDFGKLFILLAAISLISGLSIQLLFSDHINKESIKIHYSAPMAESVASSVAAYIENTKEHLAKVSSNVLTLHALDNKNPAFTEQLVFLLKNIEEVSIIDRENIDNIHIQHNYILQNLASRAIKQNQATLELVWKDGKKNLFIASPITENNELKGLLLAKYGEDWFKELKTLLPKNLGQITLANRARVEDQIFTPIISIDYAPVYEAYTYEAAINNHWQLIFTPKQDLRSFSFLTISFPWLIALAFLIVSMMILYWYMNRLLKYEQKKLYSYLSRLFKENIQEPPSLLIDLFSNLVDVIKTLNKPSNKEFAPQQKKNKEVKSQNVLQPERHLKKDSESILDEQSIETQVPRHIFRAYDIRGIVKTELNEETMILIGLAIGSEIQQRGFNRVNLAWDGRTSSPMLARFLQQGLTDSGCSVTRLGMITTGALYYATHELDTPCGLMLTGSHNPPEYNGLKVVIDNQPLTEGEILGLWERIQNSDFTYGKNTQVIDQNIEQEYLTRIQRDIKLGRQLKIVIDAGNGVAGPYAKKLFNQLSAHVTDIYCDINGDFPNHHPDPSKPENLKALRQAVLANGADLGLAFDGDGDRVLLVDNKGAIIWPDRMLMLFIEHILPAYPNQTVLFDVKSSRHLTPLIQKLGGKALMWKTGHSMMKQKMAETSSPLGAEFSGHFYIKDKWYGFDDGLYAGARLLEILSNQVEPVSEIFQRTPKDLSTTEITLDVDEGDKFTLVDKLASDEVLTQNANAITTDGLRIEYPDGWGLVRASNTTPKLTLRFAGESQAVIRRIQAKMKQALTAYAPDIKVPF